MTTVIALDKPKTLLEIVDHLGALLDTVDMVEDPEQRKQIEAELQQFMELEVRKVDGIAGYFAHLDLQERFADEEIKRLQQRKAALKTRGERLKQNVIGIMDVHGLKKLEGRTSTFTIRNCPPAVDITDESRVPAEFKVIKQETVIDKKAIAAALKANQDVPGADLVYGRSLRRD